MRFTVSSSAAPVYAVYIYIYIAVMAVMSGYEVAREERAFVMMYYASFARLIVVCRGL